MEMRTLTPMQRYAAAGLFTLSLHRSQIHQSRPYQTLASLEEEGIGEGASIGRAASVSSDHPEYWIHEGSGLLWPVFRVLEVDEQCWLGLQETAGCSSQIRHHVGAFLKLLVEEKDGNSPEMTDKELALAKAVDAMVLSTDSTEPKNEEKSSHAYEVKCQEKYLHLDARSSSEGAADPRGTAAQILNTRSIANENIRSIPGVVKYKGNVEEGAHINRQRKLAVLYELLSSCMVDNSEDYGGSTARKVYDARHRVALRLLATWLGVKWTEMEALEIMVACSLASSFKDEGPTEEESGVSESSGANWKRRSIIGAAALSGGAVMAITGGLAAPAIAHGLGVLAPTLGSIVPAVGVGGFAAAATATGSAAGSIAVAFGAAGAGLTGYKMARRIGEIEEFEFEGVGAEHNQGRLAVEILVSGLAFEDDDFVKPWEGLGVHMERYALKWESKNLIALSTAVQDWLTSRIAMELMKEGAMLTVLSSLVAALALPATLVTASDLIDSQWSIAINRSDKAGKLLSDVLLRRLQGNRPVTFIGFSLGARVIFKCLECLAEARGDTAGIVERVVLLGAPVSIHDENWGIVRKMVAGRFVNVYSQNDWTLGIAFRASLLSKGLAGIQKVDIPGVENVDVSELLEGHASYLWRSKAIIEQLELDSPYPVSSTTTTTTTTAENCS